MEQPEYLQLPPDTSSIAAAALVASKNRNRRRTRTKFETEQILLLESAFQKTHYPDVNVVDRLADELRINTERISVWFQNRRARFKREKHHNPSSKSQEDFLKQHNNNNDSSLFTEHDRHKNDVEEENNKLNAGVETRPLKKSISRNRINSFEEKKQIFLQQTVELNEQSQKETQSYPNKQIPTHYDAFNSIYNQNGFHSNQAYPNYPMNELGYPNFIYPYMLNQRYSYASHEHVQLATPGESKETSLVTNSPGTNDSRSDTPTSSEEYDVKKERITGDQDQKNISSKETSHYEEDQNNEEQVSEENDEEEEEESEKNASPHMKTSILSSSCNAIYSNGQHPAYSHQIYPNYAPHASHTMPNYANFFHPYMIDQKYYAAHQHLQHVAQPYNTNENVLSPSSSDSRSNSPASSSYEYKQEPSQYMHQNYSNIQLNLADNTGATEYASVAYKTIFQPYADCNTESYTSNQTSFHMHN